MGKSISRIILFTVSLVLVMAAAAGAKTISMAWDASTDTSVTGYKIYYGNSPNAPYNGTSANEGSSPVDVGNNLAASLSGLVNEQVHYLAVTAYDAAGNESDYSNVAISSAILPPANNAPVFAAIGGKSVAEGAALSFTLSASDPDGDSLSFSASGLPNGASFNPATRTFSWTPGYGQAGSYTATFNVSDGSLSDAETVAISVANSNRAPALAAIGGKSVAEDAALAFTLSASDPDGDSLSFSASGLPTGASFNPATRTFSWTPGYGQAGSYTATFNVSDGSLSDAETVAISVANSNRAPALAAIGGKSVAEDAALTFTLSASDPDGDSLSFSASGLPTGASFNPATRTFSWTPDYGQAGSYTATFNVSDGSLSDAETVAISVSSSGPIDSDGDGVVDSQDAFPNDPAEWLDTDLDGLGNNSDPDDDNDGVIDARDGAPLDAASSSWVITAQAGSGGQVTPAGDSLLDYGTSQGYAILPDAGFQVEDVLVDGFSVGALQSYLFTNVAAHHSIEATFAALAEGFRPVPGESGLPGVERADGGNDSGNLVNGMPRADLDYVFRVIFQDSAAGTPPSIFLVLNGFAYRMAVENGAPATGATYAFTTGLGPIAAQSFHYESRDAQGSMLERYPADYELDAPQVELLNGPNIVGAAGQSTGAALDSQNALGTTLAFRWISAGRTGGHYELVNDSGVVRPGEGYIIKRLVDPFLPPLAGTPAASLELPMVKGWNLVSNAFGGNVALRDILVRRGSSLPVSWASAASQQLVIDGLFAFTGEDWGNTTDYLASGGPRGATLVPGIGYWVYINADNEPVSLIVSRPQE